MPRPWYEKTLERTHKRHSRIMALADLSPVVDILFILAVTLFVCSGLVYRPGVAVSETDYGATIKSVQGKFLADVVSCDPAEFDAVYDAGIQDILNSGAQQMIDGFREAYNAGNYRGVFPGDL